MQNIIASQGLDISVAGILVVFLSLILISLVIHLFNRIFQHSSPETSSQMPGTGTNGVWSKSGKKIPENDLIAIAAAVEVYRKIHFEPLQSQITFKHGDQQSPWNMAYKFGQRVQKRK
ncbi:OadG family protein [bacterium]|nr:OadG family protein [bacterium]